jgi:hypothetical protein
MPVLATSATCSKKSVTYGGPTKLGPLYQGLWQLAMAPIKTGVNYGFCFSIFAV